MATGTAALVIRVLATRIARATSAHWKSRLTVSLLISYNAPVSKVVQKLLTEMRATPRSIGFSDVLRVATHYFGEPRIKGSHHIFKMPWAGDPRINIQNSGDRAKPYQVRQLLLAVEKYELLEQGKDDA